MNHGTRQFVGRETETREAHEQIRALQHGLAPQTCLINYYGTYGLGKRALLAELFQRASAEPNLTTIALTLPEQPAAERTPTPEAKRELLRQIGVSAQVRAVADTGDDDSALAEIAADLVARATPTMLLIDGEARATPVLLGWIERGLLLPLVRERKVATVITSRTPLRWREFDTRRRAESRSLPPLSSEETAAQVGVGPIEALEVQAITLGHPLANMFARERIAEGRLVALWDDDERTALARRIVTAIYERAGPGLTAELRGALEVLAVAREFALPLIQTLLPPFCPDFAQPRSQSLQLVTIRQLQELDLVTWDQQSLSYQITPLVRRLIASAVRRENPERYAAIQRAAIAYYARQLDEVPISRHIHLAELLWHSVDGEGVENAPTMITSLARTYLVSRDGRLADEESLAALRGRLRDDIELAIHLNARGAGLVPILQALDTVAAGGASAA